MNGRLKPVIGDDTAAKFLEKFPRRSRAKVITHAGPGGAGGILQPRVMIRRMDPGNPGAELPPRKARRAVLAANGAKTGKTGNGVRPH